MSLERNLIHQCWCIFGLDGVSRTINLSCTVNDQWDNDNSDQSEIDVERPPFNPDPLASTGAKRVRERMGRASECDVDGILSWPTESAIKGSDRSRGSCWDVRRIRYASYDSDSCSSNIWYKGGYDLKRLVSAIRFIGKNHAG